MAMRILHFTTWTPDQSDTASYFDIFLEKMAETTEVHLAQLTPEPKVSRSFALHDIGNSGHGKGDLFKIARLKRKYLTLLYQVMPQIIHIHGCYDYASSRIMKWSIERGFTVVYSPYGGMNPHFIEQEYGMRTWKMILYQKAMTTKASCVVVSDKEEEAYLRSEKIADRIQFIPDPRDGDYVDLDSFSANILRLYQKILDTDKGTHLDKCCHEAVSALLHVSMAGEQERKPLCPEDILNLRAITPRQWRDIMIYSSEQGIGSHLMEGIARAQLQIPSFAPDKIEQFPARTPKEKSRLEDKKLLSNSWLTKRKLKRLSNVDPLIRRICIMLFNLRHHSQKQTLCLRHLCDLYEVFRFEDFDEDLLKELLENIGLLPFARRICQVLSETIYLEQGFMPVTELDDGGTSEIRTNLIKY